MAGVPLPLHERVPDEELASQRRVDAAVLHQAVGDQRYAVQRHALAGHDGRALARPVGLGVGPLDQVGAEAFGPLGVDRGVLAGPEAGGLDELGAHQEAGVAALEHAAGEHREPGVAGADVLPQRAPLAGLGLLPLLQRADVAEQAGQQGLVDAVLVGGVRRVPDVELHLLGDLAQLGLVVLPLADPHVVEVLALAHPPEGARRQLLLLLLDVAPQVEPGEEVAGLVREAGVQLVGLRALLLRPLARVLDREGGGDHEHVAHAPEALGLEDHPAQPRVDRQPGQALADGGEAYAGRGRAADAAVTDRRSRPDRRCGAVSRGDRAELLEQVGAGLDVAAVGRLDEGEAGDVTEAQRGHLEDDAGEVGPQDLGVGELRAALEVLLASRAGSRCRRTRDRSGRSAGWPRPG